MTLADLALDLIVEYRRCPSAVKLKALSDAAREFCRRTENLERNCAALNEVAGQAAYTLAVPISGFTIRRVRSVHSRGNLVLPCHYTYDAESRTLTLDHAPLDAYPSGLVAKVVLMPPRVGAFTLPPEYLDLWGEGIAHGAAAALKKQKGQPWSDREGAVDARREFLCAVNAAMRERIAGYRDVVINAAGGGGGFL